MVEERTKTGVGGRIGMVDKDEAGVRRERWGGRERERIIDFIHTLKYK